ncbi:hypothetical protein OF83DRAFT_1088016 [Amylostereum chailletii]|nr:hypothetical protein OF83DRAFT_1088016 [Amylostereum chailletii]
MSTVTALELSRFEHFIPGFPDLYKFYAFLSASPNLETLAVENWLPKSSVMDQANLPVLDFPSLSRLSISGGVETCHAFLRSLRIPGRAELNFNFTIDDFEEDYDTLRGPVGQLLSAAWKHISGDRANVANDRRWCLSLELETEYTSQIRIFTRDEEMKPFCDHPLEPSFPCFRDLLRIRIPFHTFSFFRELGPILESGGLAPTEVEILDIRYHNIQLRRETLTGWRELFKIFPNVHTLFINSHRAGNHPVRELPQLLSEPADCSEDLHTSTPVVLPALRYLWMHHVTAECPEYTTEGLLCFQYDILKMLRYRVGVGLQHLRLGRVLTELDDGFPEHAAALRESFVGRASKVLPIVWENRFKDCDHELPCVKFFTTEKHSTQATVRLLL